ncbi:hypothetical protein [Nostoc parmelioides]|uniref:Uncharacterized protein n=1 Tax=Nostoc parmelioides FACHB-3921 TaxID=2692909 RepID=A0ABR8BQE4_9NOSO|nr:hypothetical protein [Nostoc parmelioides]MBD2255844.1 hypothetical protein [Nostoc parmelioides FACHB-3921]
MLKRRTILASLAALGFILAVSTQVYGTTATGPNAWETVYNNAVAHATTTIPQSSLLGIITGLIDDLVTFLNVYHLLNGFWAG